MSSEFVCFGFFNRFSRYFCPGPYCAVYEARMHVNMCLQVIDKRMLASEMSLDSPFIDISRFIFDVDFGLGDGGERCKMGG